MDNLTAIISPLFCFSDHVHLTIVRRPIISASSFLVTDENGNNMFRVKEKMFSFHSRHILLDSKSVLIATFRKKILSVHKRWQVFQGGSSGRGGDLFFTTKNSSLVDFKIELDVFLAGNKEERSWDFKVVGNWAERSGVVYDKDSMPIAQMQKKHKLVSTAFGKDNFHVTVYPQVDCAFIVALVAILGKIHEDKED